MSCGKEEKKNLKSEGSKPAPFGKKPVPAGKPGEAKPKKK
jgi:hypothetical protein